MCFVANALLYEYKTYVVRSAHYHRCHSQARIAIVSRHQVFIYPKTDTKLFRGNSEAQRGTA